MIDTDKLQLTLYMLRSEGKAVSLEDLAGRKLKKARRVLALWTCGVPAAVCWTLAVSGIGPFALSAAVCGGISMVAVLWWLGMDASLVRAYNEILEGAAKLRPNDGEFTPTREAASRRIDSAIGCIDDIQRRVELRERFDSPVERGRI